MAVIAILSSIGVGLLLGFGKHYSLDAEVAKVGSIIRTARTSALSSRALTIVQLAEVDGMYQLYVFQRKPVGLWHFEEPDKHATAFGFGNEGKLFGGTDSAVTPNNLRLAQPGKFGHCFDFVEDGPDSGYVDCGKVPTFSPREGVAADAWVMPCGDAVSVGDLYPVIGKYASSSDFSYSMWLEYVDPDPAQPGDESFALKASIRTNTGGGTPYEASSYKIDPAHVDVFVPPDRWTHVAMQFPVFETEAAGQLKIYVDGMEADSVDADGKLMTTTEGLYIGKRESDFFNGLIDEPRLFALVSGERYTLPAHVYLSASSWAIFFDTQGRLHPKYHDAEVTLRFDRVDDDKDGYLCEDPVEDIDLDHDGEPDPAEQVDNDGDGLLNEDPPERTVTIGLMGST